MRQCRKILFMCDSGRGSRDGSGLGKGEECLAFAGGAIGYCISGTNVSQRRRNCACADVFFVSSADDGCRRREADGINRRISGNARGDIGNLAGIMDWCNVVVLPTPAEGESSGSS